MSYREAINQALIEEMRRDDRIFIYGLDVADHKRIFGSTAHLLEEFGTDRCFATPISEEAMTGFGLGAAMNGLRPIHVHIRVDFLLLAMNQLANMISTIRYSTNGKMTAPIVIRAIIGRGWGQSAQHSKSLQSIFAHIPGLKVYMPSTPSDAKNMLIFAIRQDDPVVLLEHRFLYDVEGDVTGYTEDLDLETPQILREGEDLTIAATSWMNVEAIQAADILKKYGVSTQVIDVRSVSPFNEKPIISSVKKTKRCIIADNDWLHCGFSSEISSRVYDQCFSSLKSPIARIGFAPVPCPCTRPLENLFYSGAEQIIRAAEKILGLDPIDLSEEDFYSYENKFKGPF
ncbi:MAG: alpha-ketoacid dehydrogenase subunit beta [Dehalobacter sp.]|nr:alpha-ketoacid dehydrogenase subunit beta [Dehalobacter sp.]